MKARILVAPDSFKGSIAAAAAAAQLRRGWLDRRAEDEVIAVPIADGGEGTLAAFEASLPGSHRVPIVVTGPHGLQVRTSWLCLPDGATAVVELASTSGIELLGTRLLPLTAHTLGFGEAITAALDAGTERLVLGIGSSASTDGGTGLLRALGARFFDVAGAELALGGGALHELDSVDLDGLRPLPPGGVTVLSDVHNPLLGLTGAAAVYGPQKGADADAVAQLEAGLARFAELVDEADADAAGAGAAGGSGFGLLLWGASLVPGASEVAELVALPELLAGADFVITGEGSYDPQSAAGKAPGVVARLASEAGTPLGLVAGRITPDAPLQQFTAAVSLSKLAGSADRAIADPAAYLRAAGAMLADDFSARGHSPRSIAWP